MRDEEQQRQEPAEEHRRHGPQQENDSQPTSNEAKRARTREMFVNVNARCEVVVVHTEDNITPKSARGPQSPVSNAGAPEGSNNGQVLAAKRHMEDIQTPGPTCPSSQPPPA